MRDNTNNKEDELTKVYIKQYSGLRESGRYPSAPSGEFAKTMGRMMWKQFEAKARKIIESTNF